jgi:hypothetical protein
MPLRRHAADLRRFRAAIPLLLSLLMPLPLDAIIHLFRHYAITPLIRFRLSLFSLRHYCQRH